MKNFSRLAIGLWLSVPLWAARPERGVITCELRGQLSTQTSTYTFGKEEDEGEYKTHELLHGDYAREFHVVDLGIQLGTKDIAFSTVTTEKLSTKEGESGPLVTLFFSAEAKGAGAGFQVGSPSTGTFVTQVYTADKDGLRVATFDSGTVHCK